MTKRREEGTCFYCPEKFSREHMKQCSMRGIYLLEVDGEIDVDDNADDNDVNISLNALTGLASPITMHLGLTLQEHNVRALVDSGSTHCFIDSDTASRLGLRPRPRPGMTIGVANGDRIPCEGLCAALPVQIGDEHFAIDFYIIPLSGYQVVLGCQWLRTLGPIIWDFERRSMSFWHIDHRVHWRGLDAGHGGHVYTTSAVDVMKLLLAEFADIFTEPTGLPPARLFDHRIHLLPNTPPVAVRPYRYPQLLKDEIEKQCADMLCQGIIRHNTSPFSSPVLLVRKKDDSWRFCVDYRSLDSKTLKDKFPIPVINELLDELRGARFFTKLDLRSGYHQVLMHPDDVAKTAFRTHHGHFEFLVMAFGLTNAPSTFQALMNDVLRPFLRRFVLVFFDDILIYSSSWAEHLQHVRAVFDTLRANHLTIKQSKCTFGTSSVSYLGHIISHDGVTMDPAKVAAVQAWPTPTTVRALRGFLGLSGYYRKFIRDYETIARPLTQLLKKAAFRWTATADEAFQALKLALTSGPALQLPDFTRSFIVNCDASGSGFGAVLH